MKQKSKFSSFLFCYCYQQEHRSLPLGLCIWWRLGGSLASHHGDSKLKWVFAVLQGSRRDFLSDATSEGGK